jgi:hypothetical protein
MPAVVDSNKTLCCGSLALGEQAALPAGEKEMMRPKTPIGQAVVGWMSLLGLVGLASAAGLGLMGMGHI